MRSNFLPNIRLAIPRMPLSSPSIGMDCRDSHSHDYENCKVVSFSKIDKTKIFEKISP